MPSTHYNSQGRTLMYAYLVAVEISWLTAQGPIYTNELCALGILQAPVYQHVYVHKPSVQVKRCHKGLMAVTMPWSSHWELSLKSIHRIHCTALNLQCWKRSKCCQCKCGHSVANHFLYTFHTKQPFLSLVFRFPGSTFGRPESQLVP